MNLTLIAAIGKNNELGKNNDMIWHLPQDLKFFRKQTSGHTIVMGRKTFESLPGMLPKRHHVVISRSNPDLPHDVEIISSLEDFFKLYGNTEEEIFCIGGGMLYKEMLPYANRLLITKIDACDLSADVFFPNFDKEKFQSTVLSDVTENGIHYRHIEYKK